MKAIKLIWLADRFHLRKYGRMIFEDVYFAMKNGPVPSTTLNIIDCDSFMSDIELEYGRVYIEKVGKYEVKTIAEPNLKVFSKSDLNALETVFQQYGNLDQFELSDLSHIFPEWKKHENVLLNREASRVLIPYEDFFENVDDQKGLFLDDSERIELSKAIYKENSLIAAAF
ncbi:MAG: Panacea domain-containing protein [Nitrososphaeraceae archaeon]